MKLEWLLLAEGIGADAKGAITLIGINQNVFISAALPGLTKRAIVAHLSSPTWPEGGDLTAEFSVTSPSGKVVGATSVTIGLTGTKPPWPELPPIMDVPCELVLQLGEYGAHAINVAITLTDGSSAEGSIPLYVVLPPSP